MSIELAKEALRKCPPFALARYEERSGGRCAIAVERAHPIGVWRMTVVVSIEMLRDAVALRALLERRYTADLRRQVN